MKLKASILSGIAVMLLTSCEARRGTTQPEHDPADAVSAVHAMEPHSQNNPLFVHLIAPRYYTDPAIPPRRIVTTRITLSEEFFVALGDSGIGGEILSGRIECRDGRFFVRLAGVSHSTKNVYEGEMELDKPVSSQGGIFSGTVWTARFVLSTNVNASPFLGEQEKGDDFLAEPSVAPNDGPVTSVENSDDSGVGRHR